VVFRDLALDEVLFRELLEQDLVPEALAGHGLGIAAQVIGDGAVVRLAAQELQ
jgi:hypothetical protein